MITTNKKAKTSVAGAKAQQGKDGVVGSISSNNRKLKEGTDYHFIWKYKCTELDKSFKHYCVYMMDANQVAKRNVKPSNNPIADYEDSEGNLIQKIYFLNNPEYYIRRKYFTDVLNRYLILAHNSLNYTIIQQTHESNIKPIEEGIIARIYKLYVSITSDTVLGQQDHDVFLMNDFKRCFLDKYLKMPKATQETIYQRGLIEESYYSGATVSINNETVKAEFLSSIFCRVGVEQLISGVNTGKKLGAAMGRFERGNGILQIFLSHILLGMDSESAVKSTIEIIDLLHLFKEPFKEVDVYKIIEIAYSNHLL